jgi:bifunctional DNase/RNase
VTEVGAGSEPDATKTPQAEDAESGDQLTAGFEDGMPDFVDAMPAPGFEDPLPEGVESEGLSVGGDGTESFSLDEASTTSQLNFVDVLIVLPSSNPVVVLQEADPPYRELRIPIGGPEGIAIGYAARRIATPRPLTHELMSLILREFDLTLEVVRITGCTGGSFTAEIVVSGLSGARTIDCRPSDAIALALRQRLPVPIVAAPGVLEQAGSGATGSN